jgi:hypothetical protein
MKKYFLLVAICLCSCVHSELQSRAENAAERYARSQYGFSKYFKSVSFSALQKRRYSTALDSSLNYAGIDTNNRKKTRRYVDSENNQRPDLALSNIKDLYNIEHNRLSYYLLYYAFRVDSGRFKKFKKYRFELDTAFNVISATDITGARSSAE